MWQISGAKRKIYGTKHKQFEGEITLELVVPVHIFAVDSSPSNSLYSYFI